jgi:excisionase family DNA binding protein
MKIDEIAKRLGKSRRTVYYMIERGEIKIENHDGVSYVSDAEAERVIKAAGK